MVRCTLPSRRRASATQSFSVLLVYSNICISSHSPVVRAAQVACREERARVRYQELELKRVSASSYAAEARRRDKESQEKGPAPRIFERDGPGRRRCELTTVGMARVGMATYHTLWEPPNQERLQTHRRRRKPKTRSATVHPRRTRQLPSKPKPAQQAAMLHP